MCGAFRRSATVTGAPPAASARIASPESVVSACSGAASRKVRSSRREGRTRRGVSPRSESLPAPPGASRKSAAGSGCERRSTEGRMSIIAVTDAPESGVTTTVSRPGSNRRGSSERAWTRIGLAATHRGPIGERPTRTPSTSTINPGGFVSTRSVATAESGRTPPGESAEPASDVAAARRAASDVSAARSVRFGIARPWATRGGSEVEPEVELPFPARPDVLEVGAPRDVIAEHHIPSQAHAEPDSEASVGARDRFELLPRVPRVGEDRSLDARKREPLEGEPEHEVVEQGEAVLEVREIGARSVDASSGVAAQRVCPPHHEALRIGPVRHPTLEAHRERGPLADSEVAPQVGAQGEILRVARIPVGREGAGHVVARAVARTGGEPERVVADQRERVAGEEALAERAVLALLLVVVGLGAPLDAAEARERIGRDQRSARAALEVVDVERVPVVGGLVEDPDPVVPPMLAVDVPRARVHAGEDVPRRLRGVPHLEDVRPVAEEVAERPDHALTPVDRKST